MNAPHPYRNGAQRDRRLPYSHNASAEASILGGILLQSEVLIDLVELEPDDFFDWKHRTVFEAMRNLSAAAKPIDIVTLEFEIERQGKLESIGGVAFLGELALKVPTPDNIRAYRDDVMLAAKNRRLQIALASAAERAKAWPHDPSELFAEVLGEIERIKVDSRIGNAVSAEDAAWKGELSRALVDVTRALTPTKGTVRDPLFFDAVELLRTTFEGAKWLVSGLITVGGIVTIGGQPKAAKKTWFATELALAVATGTRACGEFFANEGVVAYFYAEDKDVQVQTRLRALATGANRFLRPGRLFLRPRGKFIDVMRDEDLAWVVASCRKIGHVDLVVLDPLRDISSAAEDKSDEMAPLMRRLRLLGELLGSTIAIVHHAGKPSESTSKRGGGQRLRGSGAIHGSTDSGIYFLECQGDGQGTFKNTVESEIKGARSAGLFTLDLVIQDNASGEATSAVWTFSREEPSAPGGASGTGARVTQAERIANERRAQEASDDARVLEWVIGLARGGVRCTRTALRDRNDDRPLAQRRILAALDRLVEARRLALVDGVLTLAQQPSRGGDS